MAGYHGLSTSYRGSRMRSRLEVRWAVMIDQLGITWEYEPTKFSLPSGVYVPDFALSWPAGYRLWLEVKPSLNVLRPVDWARWDEFQSPGRRLLLAIGPPHAHALPYAVPTAVERGDGVLLLPGGPQYSMTADGAPFDTKPLRDAAAAARAARFK